MSAIEARPASAIAPPLDPGLGAELVGAATGPDPYPLYRRLQRDYPIADLFGAVSVFCYADVATVLRHPQVSADDRNSTLHQSFADAGRLAPAYLSQLDDQSFLHRDPPDHTRLRKLVASALRGLAKRATELAKQLN